MSDDKFKRVREAFEPTYCFKVAEESRYFVELSSFEKLRLENAELRAEVERLKSDRENFVQVHTDGSVRPVFQDAELAELKSAILDFAGALVDARDSIGDMCIFPEKRKWEWETAQKKKANDVLTAHAPLLKRLKER